MQVFQYMPVMFCHLFSNSSTKNTANIQYSQPHCSGYQHLATKEVPQMEIIPELLATWLNCSAWCRSWRKQGNKKRWSADILSQEATHCFFEHLTKTARFPSSDCIGSYKKLTYSYSEISGPCCSSAKRFVCAYTLEARTMILVHKPGFQVLSSGKLLVTIIPNHTRKDIKINTQKRVTISIKTKHISYENP